jgi:hypothetical protein
MGKIRKWKNVAGSVGIYNTLISTPTDKLSDDVMNVIKSSVGENFDCNDIHIEVKFTSSGYEDEGVYSGPWEFSYPAEGSDEREMICVELYVNNQDIDLTEEMQSEIFELFYDEVKQKELS